MTVPGPEPGFWQGVAVGSIAVIPFWLLIIWLMWG
jgi:hypothetical protein